MSKVKRSKNACFTLQEIEIIDDSTSEPYDDETYTIQNSTASAPKKSKFNDSTTSTQSVIPNVILNEKMKSTVGVNTLNLKLDRNVLESISSSRLITKEDFFLKNENNCFYKCFCSQTIKSKPSYKNHLRMNHKIDMSKYHTQSGFLSATKEFCTEFIQTDYNIIETLSSIFDQIENIDKIVRDHKKRLRSAENEDHEEIKDFLESEKIVLKFHSEMIERAFDIITEKKDLICSLQEDVAELLRQFVGSNSKRPQTVTEGLGEIGMIKDDVEEEEPQYELYYVVEDLKQDKDINSAAEIAQAEKLVAENISKRGRPKGIAARSLDDCLTQLPKETAEYIRTLTANKASKYQCKMCDVTSKTKMLLCIHYMRVHLKIKNKICQYCDRAFASQGDLTRHIRIHSGEHPFKCDHPNCSSEFKTSGDLKKHKFVHDRDPSHRRFQCEECKSKFARQTDYTRHKKIHLIGKNGNVGFTCELCQKVFYRKDLFNAHINTHLQIKPFQCETCLKRFAKKYDLLKHIEKQHLIVDCDYCGNQFESKSKLRDHFSTGVCNSIALS